MFSKIDWYFSKKFISSSFLVGIVFYALFFLITLLEKIDSSLTIGDRVVGVSLSTFELFHGFVPTILLIAFLFAFGSMVSNREIVALQALGYRFSHLILTVLKGTFLVLVFWLALIEIIFPIAIKHSKNVLSKQKNIDSSVISIRGEWIRSGNSFIKIVSTQDTRIFGITIYQLDAENRLANVYQAPEGTWQNNTLTLQQLTRSHYQYVAGTLPQSLQHTRVENTHITKKDFKLNVTFDVFSYVLLEPNQMHLFQLLDYATYITKNQIDGGGSGKFIFAFWERLSLPLAIIGLILMIVPTMLGTPRVQRISDRIFWGTTLGILHFILTEVARNSSTYFSIPHAVSALTLPTILLILGVLSCYRSH